MSSGPGAAGRIVHPSVRVTGQGAAQQDRTPAPANGGLKLRDSPGGNPGQGLQPRVPPDLWAPCSESSGLQGPTTSICCLPILFEHSRLKT